VTRLHADQGAEPAAAPRDNGMFRALRVRNFRIYASANLVSLTGTWMQRIGQDWLVLQLSGDSGIALGLITALQFGPSLLLSMYGGVLADRYAKRRVLLITQALMGVLALVLGILVATGAVALWHVFVLAAGLGSVAAIDAPVRQSFVSEMVGPTLLGNAVSFAFTIGALAGMRASELSPSPPVARAGGQLRAGLAYTWAHPDLVLAMVLAFVLGTFGFNYQVTIALMSREVFHLGAEAFGLLSTAFAVGSLSGALLSTRRSVRPRQRFLVISAVVFGLFTVVAGLMPTYTSFALLLVPTGASALVFSVANNSFVQLGVDPQMRGRVMALYFMCFMGGTPVGAPVIGWISENLGAPWGLILGGGVCVVAGLAAAAFLARGRRVRVEAGLVPLRLQLRVGPPAVPSAPLRAAEDVVADRAPGVQALNG
jgi:MFS family permease